MLIITLVGIGFYYYNKSSFFKSDPVSAIPPDAPFIIRSKEAGKTLEQLFRNKAWRSLQQASSGGVFGFIDSLFRTDKDKAALWNNQELYISVHVTKASSFDFLFLMNTSSAFSDGVIDRLVETYTGNPCQKRRYENVTIREASVARGHFVYAISKGVFIASFTSFLVEDAIRQMKSGTSVSKSQAFKKANEFPQGSELTFYVNYPGLSNLAANFGSVNAEVLTNYIASAASWSALDANLQTHSVLMNGFTATGDTNQLAALFRKQFPVGNILSEIVPDRTAFLLDYGFSNAAAFFESAKTNAAVFDDSIERKLALGKLKRRYGIDVENKMTSWISSNLALAITEPGNINFTNNSFFCAEARSAEDARKKLDALRIQVNKTAGIPDKQETYRNHTISFLNIPDLAPLLYGKLFSRMGKFYYTTIRNFVVAGNTASALRSFIDDYEDKKTLALSAHGKEALQSISNSHNIFLYMRLPAMQNISKAYFPPDRPLPSSSGGILSQAFTTFTMSVSSQPAGLQTAVLWNRLEEDSKGIRLIASAKLDTAVAMRPCVFPVAGEEQKRIAVQDAGNHLYLLDETGEVLWKREMNEKILGTIYPVDFFRNGNVQLLFNTTSALHLVDLSGQYIGNYPIRFPSAAATGLSVLPGDAGMDDRIFVYCRNGQVYAYEISGKPIGNWLYNTAFGGVEKPVMPVTLKGRKYLLLYTQAGELRSLDMSGNTMNLWQPHPFSQIKGELKVFSNDSLKEQVIAGMDSSSHLALLSGDGKTSSMEPPFSLPVYDFTLMKMPGSNKYLYVFNTRDSVVACDENKTRIFSLAINSLPGSLFEHAVSGVPLSQCTLLNGGGKIFLIGNDAHVAEGFPVRGSSNIGSFHDEKDGTNTWVTGDADGTIYIYEMK